MSSITVHEKTNEHTAQAQSDVSKVSVHQLCKDCVAFFDQWKPLKLFQRSIALHSWDLPYASFLCTVVQLIGNRERCHLCALLLASLNRTRFMKRQNVLDMKVWLHLNDRAGKRGHLRFLYALLCEEQPLDDSKGRLIGCFDLETYTESECGGFHEHFAAREVPLHARNNLSRAKGWIETCLEGHTACQAFHTSNYSTHERPTRVLEITGAQDVKLNCGMTCNQYKYLALSHMWGEDHNEQIRLVEARLQDFTTSIPWGELSYIYREAIRVTRELGYRYLWIDSLCIIQDSKNDWDYEAQRMATVYGNCVCNIAYLFPSRSSSPSREDPRVWNPCILRPATSTLPGVYVCHTVDIFRQAIPDGEHDWLVQQHWPLFSRAWTFQEYLLSPRTLLYGHKNLMFQCSELFYDELLGPIASTPKTQRERGRDWSKSRYFSKALTGHARHSQIQLSSSSALQFMIDWTSLINEYRTRNLSFPSDRIIAFAGIAAAYQKIYSLNYLAGSWWEYMPLSLLWFVQRKPTAFVRHQYPEFKNGEDVQYDTEILEEEVKKLPSWSWFNMPIWKMWRVNFLFGDDELPAMGRSEREPDRSSFQYVYWADVASYKFEGHKSNQYPSTNGVVDFAGLHIRLNVLIWPVRKSMPSDLTLRFRDIHLSDRLDEDVHWDPIFTYHPDLPTISESPSPPRTATLALITDFQIVRTAGTYNIQRRLAGLVLVRGNTEGTWKRVGVWYLKLRIGGVVVELGNVHNVAERWKNYSLLSSWSSATMTLM